MDVGVEASKREHDSSDVTSTLIENNGSSSPAKRAKTASEDNHDTNRANELPVHEVVGGSSVRQYLNKHLSQHLLEGLREVSKNKPEEPLKYLGEFLIQRSSEIANNKQNNTNDHRESTTSSGIENGRNVKPENDE